MNMDNLQKEKVYNKINKYRYKMDMDIILYFIVSWFLQKKYV